MVPVVLARKRRLLPRVFSLTLGLLWVRDWRGLGISVVALHERGKYRGLK